MVQAGISPVGRTVNAMNGDTPVKQNGASEVSTFNGKKRSRSIGESDGAMENPSPNNSQRKHRNGMPGNAKSPRMVHLRDENDLDALEDDEIARTSMRSGSKGKKRRSLPPREQDRQAEVERRREKAKKLAMDTVTLPVNTAQDELVKSILTNDTVIVMAETGSGKSTQLPQMLQQHRFISDYFKQRKIPTPTLAITQPRRLPCLSLAQRVSEEMGVVLGREVGYAVRFDSKETLGAPGTRKNGQTSIRFCTEGVLLRELGNEPLPSGKSKKAESDSIPDLKANGKSFDHDDEHPNLLLRYDIIIIDEAHERTLNTDFLLGSLKLIQAERKRLTAEIAAREAQKGKENGTEISEDGLQKSWGGYQMRELKIVVMSATLEADVFSKFFNHAPILYVKGRTYPVDVYHATEDHEEDRVDAALKQCFQLHLTKPPGDILVFMPGQEEIEGLVKSLEQYSKEIPEGMPTIEALPLYRVLSQAQQNRVFEPPRKNIRKIIVSTNIAETGLTIPGIKYVVDSGLQKERSVITSASGSMSALQTIQCSRSAANQRAGRAGRTAAGECYRLYTEPAYEKRPQVAEAEILRTDLSSAILTLIAMKQNPFEFPYIDQPSRPFSVQAVAELMRLGAITIKPFRLTELGKRMQHYPMIPSRARILLESFQSGCASEIIDILSLQEAGNPILESASQRERAEKAKATFKHRDGDHLTYLAILRAFIEQQEQHRALVTGDGKSGSSSTSPTAWCKDNAFNFRVLKEAVQIRNQLRQLAQQQGHDPDVSAGEDTDKVLKCLLHGLPLNTARIQPDKRGYKQVVGSRDIKIHPSSVLADRKVPTIVYDEINVTTAFYAHTVSVIEESWLSDIPGFNQRSIQQLSSA